ncbi:thioesterase superfamily protein [Rhodovulum imhoffii]|uniref:Thioesterase superfamily protein n=1 Tax=Rhodovulum imhoffii TaxID=365340 RepID=A0A2T5BSD3_9RHOB|nr:acyl-CoA thioesterase [Rhodovulum imhoffii]MBK5933519.1 thioeseterase [Rhodovulum imhoffii]PTN02246.1 thioesterase superfamily protein [Rhodovulum imhoffii]
MYPFLRLIKEFHVHRHAPPLPLTGTHVSTHICWPWDLDIWMELNNGRTLTLLDLGRLPLAKRVGLIAVLRANRWGLTMAGVSVRYRRRVKMFDRFETRSRCVGWDDKFIYIEQGMWRKGTCANHALYRSAVTDATGIVRPERVMEAMGARVISPPLPEWVRNWIAADATRPWPPEI